MTGKKKEIGTDTGSSLEKITKIDSHKNSASPESRLFFSTGIINVDFQVQV